MGTGILRCLLLALLLAGSHLHAQQRNLGVAPAAANEQRVALVIGNSTYKEAPLRNPANHATDMAATLRTLGFAVTLKTNADMRQMRGAIREFAQNLKRGGVGLFYFAGHGVQSRNGRNYLIPVGADLKEEFELEDEAVDANRVLAGMEEAGSGSPAGAWCKCHYGQHHRWQPSLVPWQMLQNYPWPPPSAPVLLMLTGNCV